MGRIVDGHVHAYPPEVFADPRAWAAARQEPWWADAVAPVDRPSIQGWADCAQLLRDMDAAGVDQAVMLGWYWQNQATCEQHNHWMAAWRRQHPDRLQAFVAVNPASGPAALTATRRWLRDGFRGIGELLAPVQGYTYQDDDFAALVALAQEFDVPINLHVTDPKLDARPGMMPTPLAEFPALAQRHPATNFILAHLGGGLPWQSTTTLPSNLHFDTAAVPLIYDDGCYRRAIDRIGADRLIFGTDYPLRLYRARSRQPEFARMVAAIRAADLTRAEFDAIMGSNLLTLLHLD